MVGFYERCWLAPFFVLVLNEHFHVIIHHVFSNAAVMKMRVRNTIAGDGGADRKHTFAGADKDALFR